MRTEPSAFTTDNVPDNCATVPVLAKAALDINPNATKTRHLMLER
jgi:hypothetical protein